MARNGSRGPRGRSASLHELMRSIRLVVFDFDGVFTDNTVWVSQDGNEWVRCWRGDGLGLRLLEGLGIDLLILSTEVNPVVLARSRKLKVTCIQYPDGDKLEALHRALAERGLRLDQVAYVGNDINDASCLAAVGLPIVVGDAHPAVRKLGRIRTRQRGGRGAVREVCDTFVEILGTSRAVAGRSRRRGGRA
ncbi:MAG: HAD hydrolase family protein [Gemmatimonadetes bacterium]|nr:HAD hydrolase family protein [Gemmatimonadota bacterium]